MPDQTLYLIRHAFPKEKQYDNRYPGPGLGELGRRQAAWIRDWLVGKQLDQVWGSDFNRTRETAEIALENHRGAAFQFDLRLREREATEESHQSLVARVGEFFAEIILPATDRHIAIFAHGGSLNMLLDRLDPGYQQFDYPYLSPHEVRTPIAGIWQVEMQANHKHTARLIQCPIQSP